MSNLESFLWWFCIGGVLVSWIVYLIFGQVTVRKLRKNPALKDKLGFEFVGGYDILNVASALSSPKWFRDRFNRSGFAFLAADYQALYENTNLFDRILARTFWLMFSVSGWCAIILVALNAIGVLD